MIVNVKKRNGDEIQYMSDLGLLDLSSMMGYLFASDVISEWSIEEYEPDEVIRPRNEWLYNLEKRYVRTGEVFMDSAVNI